MGEFMKQKLSFILLLTITIIWGGAFVFQNLASQYVSSFTFNFLRFFIASIALLPLSIVSYRKDVKNGNKINAKQLIIGSVLCGGFLSLASILQQYGIQYTSVGKAGFITSSYILIIPLISLIFKKRYGINVYIAVFLSLIGLYLLCVNDSFTFEKGDLFLLGCALCFAIQIMIIEYFAKKVNNLCLSLGQSLFSCLICILPMIFIEQPSIKQITLSLPPVLYVAIMSTVIGYTGQIVAQKHINPTIASLIMSLESVFSVIFGALILKQFLLTNELIGCIIMFISIIFSQLPENLFKFKRKKL